MSLAHFGALHEGAPESLKPRYAGFLDYARRHADIIFRFGRYPHRNKALERPSLPEEEVFLGQPGSSFW